MIINFKSGSSGFANYVLEGTKEKVREQEKIEVIENDLHLVEKISNNDYYRVLISAEIKLSNDEMKEIYQEVKKNIFVGYKEDEYTCSAIIHQDTEHSHIHMIIPKHNLLTGNQLRLYMHNIDTKRIVALQDHIALKHNLKTIEERKPIIQEPRKQAFEIARERTYKEPFQFSLIDKKSKALAEQKVNELVKENINSINSLDEVKELIHSNTNLKVVNEGFERKKQFHYLTVQDPDNKKTRVKGEVYSQDFYKQPKEQQYKQFKINHKSYDEVEKEQIAKQVKANLRRENEKRYKVVQSYGKRAKAQAYAEQQKIQTKGKINEYSKPQQSVARLQKRDSREVPRADNKRETLINMRTMSNINLLCDRQPKLLLSEDKQPNSISRDNTRDNNQRVQPTINRNDQVSSRAAKRGELNDSTRANARTSKSQSTTTRTEQRPARARSTRRRAIALYKERIAALEEIRRTRERVLKENERAATTMRTNIAFDSLTNRNEYENLFNRIARNLKSTKDKILGKINELKNKYISFFSKVEKKEPILSKETKEYIKEKKEAFKKDDTNISKLEFSTMRTKANADIEAFKEGQKQIKEQMKNRITKEDLKRDSEIINSKNKYKNQDLGRSR